MHSGKAPRVLITGGPTRAYLDRVRFLSNVSTGALAHALARQLKARGVKVAAVVGPTCHDFRGLGLTHFVSVETNRQMETEVLRLCRAFRPDFAVFSAAVLDFEPVSVRPGKRSSRSGWTVRLRPTPKIIDRVGRRFPGIRRIGFKLEWASGRTDWTAWASRRMREQGLEALCLNFLSEIEGKRHPARLFSRDGKSAQAPTKEAIARWITRRVSS